MARTFSFPPSFLLTLLRPRDLSLSTRSLSLHRNHHRLRPPDTATSTHNPAASLSLHRNPPRIPTTTAGDAHPPRPPRTTKRFRIELTFNMYPELLCQQIFKIVIFFEIKIVQLLRIYCSVHRRILS